MTWLGGIDPAPNHTFIAHAEPDPAQGLKAMIESELHWDETMTEYVDSVELK